VVSLTNFFNNKNKFYHKKWVNHRINVLEESEKSDSQEKKAHTTSAGFEITFKVSKSMQ